MIPTVFTNTEKLPLLAKVNVLNSSVTLAGGIVKIIQLGPESLKKK